MRKRPRTSLDTAIVDVWKREVGELSTRNFSHRLGASEDLVLRLELFRKLEKHRGCVNAVSFNADGEILVSGSDDRRVTLWDWQMGRVKLSFHSGHSNNVFQAKIMPYTEDRTIVTCAADGQVRRAQIPERGQVETKLLGKHQGRVHKLAIEPGSPYIFYTCGEDGVVQHFDLRTRAARELFTCYSVDDASRRPINLYTIAIDQRNPNMFVVAGSDAYARLYDIRKHQWDGSADLDQPTDYFCPQHLIGDEYVGITGLAFSDYGELLVSYNDESIYLFTRDMGLGSNPTSASLTSIDSEMKADQNSADSAADADAKVGPQVYKGHKNCKTVKGVNFFGPKCEYVVSGSDCGRIFIWKKKGGELVRVMEADEQVVNCIECHPHMTLLASSGIEHDIKIWTPKAIERAVMPVDIEKVPNPDQNCFFLDDDDDDDEDYVVIADGDYIDDDIIDDGDEDEEEDDEDDDDDDYDYMDEDDDDSGGDGGDSEKIYSSDGSDNEQGCDDYNPCSNRNDGTSNRDAETQGKGLDVPHGFTRGPDVAVGFTPKAEDKSGARWRELVCGTGTEFLLTYGANSDGSSEDGGDRPSAEDHFN